MLVKLLSRSLRMGKPLLAAFCKRASHMPIHTTEAQTFEFKTQTNRVLDIVARSLYTDKEVFLRELLSNSSDAIEKRRFQALKDGVDEGAYQIFVSTSQDKRQLVIQDNGVGMSKQELVDNLGTIAKSGSKQFVEEVAKKAGSPAADSIIGQFGVGFYSSFIVAHSVEVVSRRGEDEPAYCWASDGSGKFSVGEVKDCEFKRGTKVVLHLRPECEEFSKAEWVQDVIKKYSNFINSPVFVDGAKVNVVQAIWARQRAQVTQEEYAEFYKSLSGEEKFSSKLHYSTDVPLAIKALLYLPRRSKEQLGQHREHQVHLYSRKVAIRRNCKELLPEFMRFVHGVVDCEDLPLNISRQNYQDSGLVRRLCDLLARRLIRHLTELSEAQPEQYLEWYNEHEVYLREGMMDSNYRTELAELLRYKVSTTSTRASLAEYVKAMKPGQNAIYYYSAPDQRGSFLEPYNASSIPVLLGGSPYEELIFMQLGNYKGYRFVNIETNEEDMSKLFQAPDKSNALPQAEFNALSLWIKEVMAPVVSKVQICTKPIKGPAFVRSPFSSTMRTLKVLQQAMDNPHLPGDKVQDLILELNLSHPLMATLNELRKSDPGKALPVLRVIVDSCLLRAGIPTDPEDMSERILEVINLAVK